VRCQGSSPSWPGLWLRSAPAARRRPAARRGALCRLRVVRCRSRRRPSRATCLHEAGGQHNRGGSFFAIKPLRSASIPRSGLTDTLARMSRPIWPISCNFRLRRLLRTNNSPPRTLKRVNLRSSRHDRGVTHGAGRVASVPGGSRRALEDRSGAALPIRSPPHQAWASPCLWPRATKLRMRWKV